MKFHDNYTHSQLTFEIKFEASSSDELQFGFEKTSNYSKPGARIKFPFIAFDLKKTFQEIFEKRFINSAVIQMISYTCKSG